LPSPTWRQRFELARFDLVDHPLSNLRCRSQLARLAIGARSRTRRERYGESRCRSWDLRRWRTACLANRPVTGHRGHRSIRPAVASTSIRSRSPRSGVQSMSSAGRPRGHDTDRRRTGPGVTVRVGKYTVTVSVPLWSSDTSASHPSCDYVCHQSLCPSVIMCRNQSAAERPAAFITSIPSTGPEVVFAR